MLAARNLWRSYQGVAALKGLDLEVEKGSAYGFIGPNGAGKSTTLRILATLDPPDAGRVWLDGRDAFREPEATRARLGWMPDPFELYDDLRVEEYLDFYGRAYGFETRTRRRQVERAIDLTRIGERRRALCGSLSKGWRQRVLLAKTLVHDPDVLLLDEPASGLDPAARIEFREVVRTLRELGKTLVISSHILTELADFCDSVGILSGGRMLVSGKIEDILCRLEPHDRLDLELLGDVARAEEVLRRHPRVGEVVPASGPAAEVRKVEVRLEGREDPALRAELVRLLVEAGLGVASLRARREGLEGLFLRVSGNLGGAEGPLPPAQLRALLGAAPTPPGGGGAA